MIEHLKRSEAPVFIDFQIHAEEKTATINRVNGTQA